MTGINWNLDESFAVKKKNRFDTEKVPELILVRKVFFF
jgi:hypothetical protein